MEEKHLTQVKNKETAVVKTIIGGHGIERRLESMGIRPGKRITMISRHFWGGPVTVMVDRTKVAIGHGMARKVIVEG
jgi:ferrous iron transport protein A